MSKPTPGPWTQTLNDDESAYLIESDGRYIADVHRWTVQPNHAESEANARLIAAAPNLLSIARLALKASQIDINDLMGRIEVNVLLGMIGGAAKVALAKVDGKEEVV